MQKAVPAHVNFLSGGGEMGQLIRSVNWAETPLGPPEEWPPCLKISISIMLHSGYPMFIWWGPDLTMFHNDAYLPVLGKKHPEALGKSARKMWSEIWHDVGPLAENVFQGKEVYLQDLLLYLGRKGFLEETYWTFSYSPIISEDGSVSGLFCACNEETRKIIGLRRLRTLQQITGLSSQAETVEEVGKGSLDILSENGNDIPFSFLYLMDTDGNAVLVGSTGIPGQKDKTEKIDLLSGDTMGKWPLDSVMKMRKPYLLRDLKSELNFNVQTHSGIINSAAVMPLQRSGGEELAGFLVCGISPAQEYDEDYQNYFITTAAQISTAIADIKAFEAERKRSESLLELARLKDQAEQNIHNLFMQAPVGIVIVKGDNYEVELVNASYLPIVQKTYEDLIHKSIFETIPEIEKQGFREILNATRETGETYHLHEYKTIINRNGRDETIYLNVVYQPIKELDGSYDRVMALVVEVTEAVVARKKIEELNHLLEEQVDNRTKDLKQANAELERSNKELEQFAYAASHDMQEPLRKIQTFASFLTDDNKPATAETNKKYISKIQESAKRMSGIIEDLLNYSYQGTENKFTNTDLNEIVANVIYDLELLVNQKSALIQYDNLPVIEAVPSQMHQLFYNLINNSLKFSKVSEPPRIFITSRLTENPAGVPGVSLNLSDNGIGFEPEYADKIFQLFKRLNDKHSYSGSGIGLALCKKIVNNHNGSIVAEGELNKGASFDIWLPVKQ